MILLQSTITECALDSLYLTKQKSAWYRCPNKGFCIEGFYIHNFFKSFIDSKMHANIDYVMQQAWSGRLCNVKSWENYWFWLFTIFCGQPATISKWPIVGVLSLSYHIDRSLLYNFMRFLPVIVMIKAFRKPPADKLNLPSGGHIG